MLSPQFSTSSRTGMGANTVRLLGVKIPMQQAGLENTFALLPHVGETKRLVWQPASDPCQLPT
jgi:hypothetical protein